MPFLPSLLSPGAQARPWLPAVSWHNRWHSLADSGSDSTPRSLPCSRNPVGQLARGMSRCISSSGLVLASHVPALPSRLLGGQGLTPSEGRWCSHSFAHITCSGGSCQGRAPLAGLSLPLILEEGMGGKEPECCLTSSKGPRKAPEPMAKWQQPSIPRVPEQMM